MSLKSINPANGQEIAAYEEMSTDEVNGIITAVNDAFNSWRKTSFSSRGELLKNAAVILQSNKEEFGRLMSLEMGKPYSQSLAEVVKCAKGCEYYADNTEEILADRIIETDASKSYVSHQPIGIVLAVMPWNFPFWQVFRFAAPALMAGNVGVLKHASNVQGCALAIEKIFVESGFPENVFRALVISSKNVESVINNPLVKAVTLTGSTPAGRAVASQSGAALKKTVLELGGSDPYVILKDADLDQAVEACVIGRLLNTGQSCIAAKRFIVVADVLGDFQERLIDEMRVKKWGDPFEEDIDLGPMVDESARDELHSQVVKSIEGGAEVLLGGAVPDNPGAYYPATVLGNVRPGMPAFDEELFGPVAAVIAAENEAEAIKLANQTPFGLGAAVFTSDIKKGEKIASEELEAGSCFVNDFVRSDPRLPFGGIKASGYGRELSSNGILEFVNSKTVYIR
ncbi:MAG: succinate-semialdehyde dehydrogenase [Euryarchaeota archaeon]|nr:succinate-semialdehyde dehydrogenase [Candidatus Neomarinimicrobiota bacterium]MBT92645.1 succinate-semialdehyde dehydrogenase [Euryarchaeota archaeon]|tara:strand:- start:1344 stop:2711 length:1368 start_codon:yes stop_codon:yes gene_type:complete